MNKFHGAASRRAKRSIRIPLVSSWAVAAVSLLGALSLPSVAWGDYEQVPEHFAASEEANQAALGGIDGMAVNTAGAGGVEPGTFYAVTSGGNKASSVLRFSPGTEGEEPQFEEAWGWEIATADAEFQRCGPALTTEPSQHTFHTCAHIDDAGGFGGEEPGHFERLSAVAVDPANGNVYVRNLPTKNHEVNGRLRHLIEVFTPTGTPIGEGFGDAGTESSSPPESIAEGPGKLHRGGDSISSMTVSPQGTVYLNDEDYSGVAGQPEDRVLSFEPENGTNFSHYVYSGVANDLTFTESEDPQEIAWAGEGRLVTGRNEQLHVYATTPGPAAPICSLPISGRLTALAANELTGEVFYFNEVNKKITRLSACDEVTGKFTPLQQFKPSPSTELTRSLAIDPLGSWSALRPSGILYAPTEIETGLSTGQVLEFSGDIFAPAPVLSPSVESESVAHTGTMATILQARIDPRGFKTSYSFEALSASTYATQLATAEDEGKSGAEAEDAAFAGAATVPSAPGQLESGAVGTAAASIGNLAPDTSYRFRVLATSECNGTGEPLCETDGEAATFATYPITLPGLPDGRGYELVSPSQKHGGEVFVADPRVGSCGTVICKPPGNIPSQVDPMQSAPDGGAVAYMGYPFSPTEGGVFNSYISRRSANGWKTVVETPANQGPKSEGTFAYTESLDQGIITGALGGILLQDTNNPSSLTSLVPSPHYRDEGELSVDYGGYSTDFSSQFFSANDALTSATAFAPEPPDPGQGGNDLYEWHDGRLSLINVFPGNVSIATEASFASGSPEAHAVSVNGERVFWRAGTNLYVRERGEETREITHSGAFVTASESGDEVLLSDGCLYSLATEGCTDLSEGAGGFQGIAGANGSLSRIYFVDTAALPGSGANERNESAVLNKPNLYLYEAGGNTRFIARLAARDGAGGARGLQDWGGTSGNERTAEASPDGRLLAFMSLEPLTGYENIGPCGEFTNAEHETEIVPGPCSEVFLFNSATGELSCPSCNPTGEAPLGNATLRRIMAAKPFFPQPRYLTDSGRLFFDSPDRLSPLDTNGRVEDVYEAEPDSLGSCKRSGGCVSLISAGAGSVDSNFLAVDENGADIFFTSRERLVQKDTDELIDLYDAREGGGFPEEESETQRSECQGESCQPPAQAPNDATPASSAFHGAGNVNEVTKHKKHKKHKHRHTRHKKNAKKHNRYSHRDRGGAK